MVRCHGWCGARGGVLGDRILRTGQSWFGPFLSFTHYTQAGQNRRRSLAFPSLFYVPNPARVCLVAIHFFCFPSPFASGDGNPPSRDHRRTFFAALSTAVRRLYDLVLNPRLLLIREGKMQHAQGTQAGQINGPSGDSTEHFLVYGYKVKHAFGQGGGPGRSWQWQTCTCHGSSAAA